MSKPSCTGINTPGSTMKEATGKILLTNSQNQRSDMDIPHMDDTNGNYYVRITYIYFNTTKTLSRRIRKPPERF